MFCVAFGGRVMQIDLTKLDFQGAAEVFQFDLDLDWFEEMGKKPFDSPLPVSGQVKRETDAFYLEANAMAHYHTQCDRCLEPVDMDIPVSLRFRVMTTPTEDEEDVYAPGGILDVDAEVIGALVLALPLQKLCKEDCKGLCPDCGCNLNIEHCDCKNKKIDPRLAVLSKLLDDSGKD